MFDGDLDRTDRRDVLEYALSWMNFERCPGGRVILDGYMCAHCGKDPGFGKCGKPKRRKKGKK